MQSVYLDNNNSVEINHYKIEILVLSSITLFSLLFGIISIKWIGKINEISLYFISFTILPIINAVLLHYCDKKTSFLIKNGTLLNLLTFIVFFCFLAYSLFGAQKIAYELQYLTNIQIFNKSRFFKGFFNCAFFLVLFGGTACFSELFLLKYKVKYRKAIQHFIYFLLVTIGFFFLVGTIDSRMILESISYGPYLGPALSFLHGGIPFIDVFSQYGLSYLLFSAVISISHYSVPAVVGLVSIVNTLLYSCYILIAINICKNKIIALLLALLSVYFVINAYIFNIVITPSVMGFRFLPLYLLVYALIRQAENQKLGKFAIALLILCSLHSLEIMLFGFAIACSYAFIHNRMGQKSLHELVKEWSHIAFLLISPHFIICAIYLVLFKRFPRYDIYLEIIGSYSDSNAKIWFIPVSSSIRLWLLFGFAYLISLSLCLYWFYNNRTVKCSSKNMVGLALVTILGILQFSYYIGRSTPTLLGVVSLPLFLILIYAFDWALGQVQKKKKNTLVFGLIASIYIIFCLVSGAFADKFFAPYHPLSTDVEKTESSFHSPNSSLLRAIIHYHFSKQAFAKIRKIFEPSVPFNDSEHYETETYQQAKEAYLFAKELNLPMEQIIPLFMDGPLFYFHARKAPIYHSSNLLNDAFSKKLTEQILEYAKRDKQKNKILIMPIFPGIQAVEGQIVDLARQTWKFCEIHGKYSKITAVQLCDLNSVCHDPKHLELKTPIANEQK